MPILLHNLAIPVKFLKKYFSENWQIIVNSPDYMPFIDTFGFNPMVPHILTLG